MINQFKVGDLVLVTSKTINKYGKLILGRIFKIRKGDSWPIKISVLNNMKCIGINVNWSHVFSVAPHEIRRLLPEEEKKYEEYLSMMALSGETSESFF